MDSNILKGKIAFVTSNADVSATPLMLNQKGAVLNKGGVGSPIFKG
jgi:hypothetical protein